MAGSDKEKKGKEETPSFDQIMKSLSSVPPKENKKIKGKARKERETKKKSAR